MHAAILGGDSTDLMCVRECVCVCVCGDGGGRWLRWRGGEEERRRERKKEEGRRG